MQESFVVFLIKFSALNKIRKSEFIEKELKNFFEGRGVSPFAGVDS